MDKVKGQNYMHGAAILTIGVIIMKLLGFIYKIPLGNILGDEGYSMFLSAYNIYNVFFALATAGLPVALSRLVAEADANGRARQEEKTFAMIEQVGGRAGRRQKGKVIVQTFNPQHYAIRFAAKHDYAGFYRQEIAFRKATGKPPFSRIYRLVFTHAQAERAQQACRAAEETLRAALRPYAQEI